MFASKKLKLLIAVSIAFTVPTFISLDLILADFELKTSCFPSSSLVCKEETDAGEYKLFSTCGQPIANSKQKSGFIHIVSEYLIPYLSDSPKILSMKAHYETDVTKEIKDQYPTNHSTPYFEWEVAESTSPISKYECSWEKDSEIISTEEIKVKEIGFTVVEEGTYILAVQAVNETGNWSNKVEFHFVYDKTKPTPLNVVKLQESSFHPLTMNLDFEFTEDLYEPGQSAITLEKKNWEDDYTPVSGEVKYESSTRILSFVPAEPLKALSQYRISFNDVKDFAGNSYSGEFVFSTYLGTAMNAEIFSSDGKAKLNVPTWALQKDALITLEKVEELDEATLKANRKIELRMNTRLTYSGIYQINAVDLEGNPIDVFDRDVTLSFFIPDADDDGIWDGSDVRLKYIVVASLNQDMKDWNMLKGINSTVTKAPSKALSMALNFEIKEANKYTLISYLAPSDSIDNVLIYPVPFRPSLGHTEVTFLRLPLNTELKILNIAGEIIREYSAPDQGQIIWDVKNNNGEEVASGVYLALIKSSGSAKIYKIAVQR
ncbi:MAG: Ig-like domain-containing protein [bacterium]